MAFIPVQDIKVSIGGAAATSGTIFNCTIYGFQMSFGVGEGQTTCSLNIVNENGVYPPELTEVDPRTGQVKYLSYLTPIDFAVGKNIAGGAATVFKVRMYLVSAKEQYGTDGKTFQLDFVDGSHILDRVYVGLLHRHDGNNRPVNVSTFKCGFDVPVLCPPCDPFADPFPTRKVVSPTDPSNGDLVTRLLDQSNMIPVGNVSMGGFIIVGKEQYSKSDCDLKDVDYSFTELKFAAARMGIIINIADRKQQYRANHVGTLREVLSSWCADFGVTWVYDSFVSFPPTVSEAGNNSPSSVLEVQGINAVARNINQTSSTALVESISYEVSIKDTYRQYPVTAYKKPSAPKSLERTTHYRTYLQHIGPKEMFSNDYLDGRTYEEFIISCVFAKYAPELRTLYLLQLGSYAPLGFTPVYVVPNDLKKQIIDTCLNTDSYLDFIDYIAGNDATLSDISQADFDMSLGSYDKDMEDNYLQWETSIADSFGKYFMTSVLGRDVTFCPKGLRFKYKNTSSFEPEAKFYYSEYEELNKQKICQPAQQTLSDRTVEQMTAAEIEKRKNKFTNDLPGGLPFNNLLRGPLGEDIFTTAPPYIVRNGSGAKLDHANYVRIFERGQAAFSVTEADFECQLNHPATGESLVAKYMPRYQEVEGLIKTRLLASFNNTPDEIRETIEGANGANPCIMITPKRDRLRKLLSVSSLSSELNNERESENTISHKVTNDTPKEADCSKTADCELQEDLVAAVCDCTKITAPPAVKVSGTIYDSSKDKFIEGILSADSLGFTFKFKPDPIEHTIANSDGTFTKQYDIFESSLDVVLPYGMSNADYIPGEDTDYNNLYQANYIEAMSRTAWSNKIQEIINDFQSIPVGNVSSLKVTPVEATQQFDAMFPTDNQGGEVINVALPPLINPVTGAIIPGGQSVTLQQYHNFIKILNNTGNHLPKVTLSVSLGSMNFGELFQYLDVKKGLQSFNVTINESGSSASISWGSGLLRLPKEDVVMTQVQPRAKYSMFVT